MKEYKLSAQSVEQIEAFLLANFNFEFKGNSSMVNQTDCFVFINENGQIPNQINIETGEVISWLDGLHFDILTNKDLTIPEGINQHYPSEPKHQFA